jgi:protein-tyrosine kinase
MGKVYDALQRAEEQRGRSLPKSGQGLPQRSELRTPAEPLAAEPRARRSALWRRVLRRRRGPKEETAGTLNKRRIALLQPESFAAEQFRTLRVRVDALSAKNPIRSIAVTSAVPGDGKTLSAVNLALVMAMSVQRKVLLVDCDLRGPRIHQALGLRLEAGLAEVVQGEAQLEEAILRAEGTELDVLPVRHRPANPSELLASNEMRDLIETLTSRYDRVIFDMPPVLGMPEARTVTDLCDGIVFVVRANSTDEADVTAALEGLDRHRVLGLVLNDVTIDPKRYGYNY